MKNGQKLWGNCLTKCRKHLNTHLLSLQLSASSVASAHTEQADSSSTRLLALLFLDLASATTTTTECIRSNSKWPRTLKRSSDWQWLSCCQHEGRRQILRQIMHLTDTQLDKILVSSPSIIMTYQSSLSISTALQFDFEKPIIQPDNPFLGGWNYYLACFPSRLTRCICMYIKTIVWMCCCVSLKVKCEGGWFDWTSPL